MSYINSVYDSNLSAKARAVYMFLMDHSNKKGECFHSIRSIANGLGVSYKTVQRAIKELKEDHWLEVNPRYRSNGGRSSNLYVIGVRSK